MPNNSLEGVETGRVQNTDFFSKTADTTIRTFVFTE
jgi:hypothetical protein